MGTNLDSNPHRAAKGGLLPAIPHADGLPAVIVRRGVPEQAALRVGRPSPLQGLWQVR